MRSAGSTDAPTGHGPCSHLCWVHYGRREWTAAVAPFLAEGASGNEALIFAGSRPEAELIDELWALPGRDALLASGQLRAVDLGAAGESGLTAPDPRERVAAVELESALALDAGWSGLRLAADPTALLGDIEDARARRPGAGLRRADRLRIDHRDVRV